MRTAISLTVAAAFFCGAVAARAQSNTATGRAFSTSLDVGGTNAFTQSDTGIKNADDNPATTTTPTEFNATAPGALVPADPLANVVTGPSTTRGCAVPSGCPDLFTTPGPTPLPSTLGNEVFANSHGGSSTAVVFPGAAPGGVDVLDAVSSSADVTVRCNNDTLGQVTPDVTAGSEVNALVIGGNVVPVPGSVGPNTEIVSGGAVIILNEQSPGCAGGGTNSASCTVTALHAQFPPPGGGSTATEIKMSSASAAITYDPDTCTCNGPALALTKKGSLVTPGDTVPNPGDTIEYTLDVTNSGCVQAAGVILYDRLPIGVTVSDAGGGTTATCPSFVPVCSAGGSSGQCLTFNVGTLDVNQSVERTFRVTVNGDSGCNTGGQGFPICNVSVAEASGQNVRSQSASSIAPCPNGTPGGGLPPPGTPAPTATPPGGGGGPTGTSTPGGPGGGVGGPNNDRLVTTGSGGCSLGGGSGEVGWLPVVSIGLLLVVRQWRRRATRAK